MKKKPKPSQLKKKLWIVFSKFVRERDRGVCFICGRRAEGSGYQASHFIPKSIGGIVLYFHEDNVHGCCYNCNINLGGNLYLYGKRLGEKIAQALYEIKKTTKGTTWDRTTYENRIAYYRKSLGK